jgi:quercetin dioxygenase-like cupin family protein
LTAFAIRSVTIPPGGERAFDDSEWRAAIVVVERGPVVLATRTGGSWRFDDGDMLWLDGLWLRALHNPGPDPAVLVAISPTPNRARSGWPSRERPSRGRRSSGTSRPTWS